MILLGATIIGGGANIQKDIATIEVAGQTIIYVDDDNTDGPWNGTTEYPYQFIQDGIDNSQSDDIIYVFNGTYYENIIINKKTTITGEHKENTIIDGQNLGKVLGITANRVIIDTFTIQNCGNYFQDAGIYIRSTHNTIQNIIFRNNTEAIHLWDAQSNTIQHNTIIGCKYGIYLITSDMNTIKNCIFSNNQQAITLEDSSQNDINGNNISNNIDGITLIQSCHFNTINGNDIIENSNYGIFLDRLFDKRNEIYHNNFIENYFNAYFEISLWNHWDNNYWDDWIGLDSYSGYDFLPKAIIGRLIRPILWVNFDWHPALYPYEKEISF
jgi:parallel beta-helix repeat protein